MNHQVERVYELCETLKYGTVYVYVPMDDVENLFFSQDQIDEKREGTITSVYGNRRDGQVITAGTIASQCFWDRDKNKTVIFQIGRIQSEALTSLETNKVHLFDPLSMIGLHSDDFMMYNSHFKLSGLMYSAAKQGFVRSKVAVVSPARHDKTMLLEIKREVISAGCTEIKDLYGNAITLEQGSTDQIDAAGLILKVLKVDMEKITTFRDRTKGWTWDEDTKSYGYVHISFAEVVEQIVKNKTTSTDRVPLIMKEIKMWWKGLKKAK
jgi:hypothetical protein